MTTDTAVDDPAGPAGRYDVLVVGAGFAGMYLIHQLRTLGFTVHAVEAAGGVGGTWYWNRYPGARCDVASLEYSYSFSEPLQQEWEWTERFAAQPEILRYAEHVADRFDLRRDITFDTRIRTADFDERAGLWRLRAEGGRTFVGRFLITAVGCLSAARTPDWPGQRDFTGPIYHTGQWPHHDVDFTGQRVAVVGTGSSGIQVIPPIAEQAAHLTVFQRTANFSLPARNRPLLPGEQADVKARYPQIRAMMRDNPRALHRRTGKGGLQVPEQVRRAELEQRWRDGEVSFLTAFTDVLTDADANRAVADFVREKIRATVTDPVTAELLCPQGHPIGTKRICRDTGYFETFNLDDVDLVDVRSEPIVELTPGGVRTSRREYPVDAVVFATGYDAMTGALTRIDIRGRGGRSLRQMWADGPRSYLGLAVAGFPNMFTVTGPGSPSVLVNVIMAIEQHVEWLAELLGHLRDRGVTQVEADPGHQDAWVAHVADLAAATLYPQADSWFIGANVPGKPRVFLPYVGGLDRYRRRCDEIAAAGYPGLRFDDPAPDPYPAPDPTPTSDPVV